MLGKEKTFLIPEYDKRFQHQVISYFQQLTIPTLKPFKGTTLVVSGKDIAYYAKLIYLKQFYAPFAKWAYNNNAFDFNAFMQTMHSESLIFIWMTILKSFFKSFSIHLLSLKNIFSKKRHVGAGATLFMLAGFEDYLSEENESLLEYLAEISKQKTVIIICNKESEFTFKGTHFIFTQNLRKWAMQNIAFGDIFKSLIETVRVSLYVLKNISGHTYLKEHVEEFIKSPFLAYGVNRHLKEIVLTNSFAHEPPLFVYFKNKNPHTVSCLWYSADYFSYRYFHDDESILPLTAQYFRADKHYFWTKIQMIFAEEAKYESEVEYTSPVVLQRNAHLIKSQPDKDTIEICLFNIIPFFREHLANCGYPQDHYVNLERCTWFLTDICSVASEIRKETGAQINILLKQKRSKNPVHRSEYYDTLTRLAESHEITLLNHNCDMVSLLQNTTLSISQPFSTPFFIARELNQPAYFYDPTTELMTCHTVNENELVRGKAELKKLILSYVKC